MQVHLESVRQRLSDGSVNEKPLRSRRDRLTSSSQVSPVQTPIDLSFIVVRCGDKNEISVNTESSIQNALLYLRGKYVEHGGRLPDHVTVNRVSRGVRMSPYVPHPDNPSTSRVLRLKGQDRRNAVATASVPACDDTWFLDLMMAQIPNIGRPLNLCNQDPLDRIGSYVADRSKYLLCLLRRSNQSGCILEAIPLLKRIPDQLSEKITYFIRQANPQQARTKLPGWRVKAGDGMIGNVVKKWKPAPVSPLVESKLKVRRGSQGSSEGDSRRLSTSSTTSSERERRSSH